MRLHIYKRTQKQKESIAQTCDKHNQMDKKVNISKIPEVKTIPSCRQVSRKKQSPKLMSV